MPDENSKVVIDGKEYKGYVDEKEENVISGAFVEVEESDMGVSVGIDYANLDNKSLFRPNIKVDVMKLFNYVKNVFTSSGSKSNDEPESVNTDKNNAKEEVKKELNENKSGTDNNDSSEEFEITPEIFY